VRRGADEKVLLRHLVMVALKCSAKAQRKVLLGINSNQAQSLSKTIRFVAGMMERAGGTSWQPGTFLAYEPCLQRYAARTISEPGYRHTWLDGFNEYLSKTPRDWHEQFLLPCFLRDYAEALERYLTDLRTLRKNPVRTAALCHLIWHVKEKTGDYHDREVSALINAAENAPNDKAYVQSAHARWRQRNERLIGRLGPLQLYPAILPGNIR
jgi:hypothetical protein